MELIKCPNCGEKYSPSYRECPFCEEERSFRRQSGRRTPQRRSERDRSGSNPLHIVIILILLVALGVMSWILFFGSDDADVDTGETTEDVTPSGDEQTPPAVDDPPAIPDVKDDPPVVDDPPVDEPPVVDDPPVVDEPPVVDDPPIADPGTDVSNAALSKTDFTLPVGESYELIVSGTTVTPSYKTGDASIATVSESGVVTAIRAGTTTVTVTVGERTLSCIVRVKGADPSSSEATVDLSGASISNTDFTLAIGEKHTLTVRGTDLSVSWSVANSAIATVSANGTVTGVSTGHTTVTATVGGKTFSCIVRVAG